MLFPWMRLEPWFLGHYECKVWAQAVMKFLKKIEVWGKLICQGCMQRVLFKRENLKFWIRES